MKKSICLKYRRLFSYPFEVEEYPGFVQEEDWIGGKQYYLIFHKSIYYSMIPEHLEMCKIKNWDHPLIYNLSKIEEVT